VIRGFTRKKQTARRVKRPSQKSGFLARSRLSLRALPAAPRTSRRTRAARGPAGVARSAGKRAWPRPRAGCARPAWRRPTSGGPAPCTARDGARSGTQLRTTRVLEAGSSSPNPRYVPTHSGVNEQISTVESTSVDFRRRSSSSVGREPIAVRRRTNDRRSVVCTESVSQEVPATARAWTSFCQPEGALATFCERSGGL
jgi:hypothetical protein